MKDNETTYKMFSILMLGVGLMMFERAFWTKEQNDVLDDSDFIWRFIRLCQFGCGA